MATLHLVAGFDGGELERLVVGVGDLDQRQIQMVVDGDDLDVLDDGSLERAVGLREPDRRSKRGLALDDVGIGDRGAVLVDDDSGAKTTGGADLYHRRALR